MMIPPPAGSDSGLNAFNSSGSSGIGKILSTASGTMSGGGAVVHLFATPSKSRTGILLAHSGGTGSMYVGFTSDVSSTKHLYAVAAGDPPIEFALGPAVDVYVVPDGTGNSYTAHEVRAR